MPRFFADTSDLAEIKKAYDTGLIFGITTNPSIIAAKNPGATMREAIEKILSAVPDIPVSVQVTEQDPHKMVEQGLVYHSWSPKRIVVKIPMGVTYEGLTSVYAINQLARKNIPVNVTSCMTVRQGYAGLAAGGRYLSLFWGRISDSAGNPAYEVKELRRHIDVGFNFALTQPKEIIVGSIRDSDQVFQAMDAGAHIITVPFSKKDGSPLFDEVVKRLISHEKTVQTNEEFYKNAAKIGK